MVMTAFRGRVVPEDPEEADLEPLRVDGPGEGGGSARLSFGSTGLGMRRAVRPPPGRIVFRAVVSWRQGLRINSQEESGRRARCCMTGTYP